MKLLRWTALVLAGLVVLAGCKKSDEETPTGPGDGSNVPAGVARIAGTVRDASGEAVPNVALHVVYQSPPPASAAAEPMIPSTAIFYNTDTVMTTECGGDNPLQDGVMVKIFWDRDGDGPDETDPQPPLCDDPPECPNGPALTATWNELPINGVAVGLGAGLFYAERSFTTLGDLLNPSLYYGRIYCTDGNVLWESDVIAVSGGYGEYPMHFHCSECEGAPVVPAWQFTPGYPNPAVDTVVFQFSLLEPAPALLTLHWPQRERVDTLLYQSTMSTGGHTLRVSLAQWPHDVYNGLYTVRLLAGPYQAEQLLLRNVTEDNALRGMAGAAVTATDGSYQFDTAAGVVLRQYTATGGEAGNLILNRVRVTAIKPGYAIADTIFDIGSAQSVALDLRMTAN